MVSLPRLPTGHTVRACVEALRISYPTEEMGGERRKDTAAVSGGTESIRGRGRPEVCEGREEEATGEGTIGDTRENMG